MSPRRLPVTRPRRGTAMLAALATVVVLAAVSAMASRSARSSAAVVMNARADAIARAMAESGVLSAVARIDAALQAAPDSAARLAVLDAVVANDQPAGARRLATPTPFTADSLGSGVFETAIVNVSARFDVNSGDAEGLRQLFATVAPPTEAAAVAARIAARVRFDPSRARSRTRSLGAEAEARRRDSVVAALLGRPTAPPRAAAFASLDELTAFLGADAPWITRVADLLTVDGDGRIDRRHAAPAVLRAASGSLVDAPTRLLIVARGWEAGQLLTREVQAVYAVEGNELRLVRWREQSR